MPSSLPVNVSDLLYQRGVESTRLEFKASWDENTSGAQAIRTICAFANDFQNLNGGYLLIGVAEEDGKAVLPPKGLTPAELEAAQKWLRGHCNRIDPVYQPVLSPEVVDGQHILVIWAPGSQMRPHQAPASNEKNERKYYIRLGTETVDADKSASFKNQLMQLTARVPFDDRRALHAKVNDINEGKVREYVQNIDSGLQYEQDSRELYRRLNIAEPVNGHDAPRNVGLLFFSQNPEQWFPGAKIEVVQFPGDKAGSVFQSKIFSARPIQEQLHDCLNYLENLSVQQIQKISNRHQTAQWVSYPTLALREALVNAVYHRSYENDAPEPIKVHLYPDRMEIISYPGPVPGIEQIHLDGLAALPPVPARNRRIGDFLKKLHLAEGYGTGIPKAYRAMQQNGSPPPRFDFDTARSYFRVTLQAHPEYQAILALQNVAHLKAIGERQEALSSLQDACMQNPGSLSLSVELAREWITRSDLHSAQEVYERFIAVNKLNNPAAIITLIAGAYLDQGKAKEAVRWLDRLPFLDTINDAFDAAIQEKRAGLYERAHRHFVIAGEAVFDDVKALHEFAQVKIKLARKAIPSGKQGNWHVNQSLLNEAKEMLMRVLQLEAPVTRHAWASYDLGNVLKWMRAPKMDIYAAYKHAATLLPDEVRFRQALQQHQQT